MSKVFNQFNLRLTKTCTLLSVLCFTLVLSSVQPVPVMANDVCAPQWYKKVAKKAKSVKNTAKKTASRAKNRVKSTAKSAASKTASYAKKGASYAKKGATTAGKAYVKGATKVGEKAYKAATSSTGKKVGKFVKEEFQASEVGKAAKGLTGKTARNFYKNPKEGIKYAVKSGIHKAKTDPGKYAKQFVKGRLESTKVGRIYSRGAKAVSIGKKLKNTSTGKKVTGFVKDKASSAAHKVSNTSTGRNVSKLAAVLAAAKAAKAAKSSSHSTRSVSNEVQQTVEDDGAIYMGEMNETPPATRTSSSAATSTRTTSSSSSSDKYSGHMSRKDAKKKLEKAAGDAAVTILTGLFSKKKSTATPAKQTGSTPVTNTPVKKSSTQKSANSAVYNLLNSAYKKKK